MFKKCAPFTDCISEINNTQVDNAYENDLEMPIHNLIEYNDNYLKTSGNLWQCYRDELAVNVNVNTTDFSDDDDDDHDMNNSTSLNINKK